jgi:hypothetical protein
MKVYSKLSTSPNCALEGLRLLGSEGASLDVNGSKVEDHEDGKLACKREYV